MYDLIICTKGDEIMLDVNFEFVRGILFVRLEGKINYDSISTINNSLTDVIKKGGIKYLVFNVTNAVIEERVSMFDECNLLIKENGGKMYMCGLKNKLETIVSDSCEKITNELLAFNKIRLC